MYISVFQAFTSSPKMVYFSELGVLLLALLLVLEYCQILHPDKPDGMRFVSPYYFSSKPTRLGNGEGIQACLSILGRAGIRKILFQDFTVLRCSASLWYRFSFVIVLIGSRSDEVLTDLVICLLVDGMKPAFEKLIGEFKWHGGLLLQLYADLELMVDQALCVYACCWFCFSFLCIMCTLWFRL